MISPSASNQFQITPDEYNAFCLFLEQATGIVLGTDKLYLVNSRLSNIMNNNKITTITMLIEKMENAFPLSVSMTVDCKVGPNWYDMQSFKPTK